jgi:hypothetical protein
MNTGSSPAFASFTGAPSATQSSLHGKRADAEIQDPDPDLDEGELRIRR